MQYLSPDFLGISVHAYREFISSNFELQKYLPDISVLTEDHLDKAIAFSAKKFEQEIRIIKRNLNDGEIGIASVDIAEDDQISPDANAYWGVALALALTANVFKPIKDKFNNTPYTVYAASPEKSLELMKMGLGTIAPETKLGFHTDGTILEEKVVLPRHIMLYNMLIEYEEPGNFYWVPFQLWEEKKSFIEKIGIGKKYRIKVTPSVYEKENGRMEVVTPYEVEVPIFPNNEGEDFPLYLNGDIVSEDVGSTNAVNLIGALRNSIQTNKQRYAIPQRTRRIIFACNTKGAHARDIFEKPRSTKSYTRIFMRAVDEDSVELECL